MLKHSLTVNNIAPVYTKKKVCTLKRKRTGTENKSKCKNQGCIKGKAQIGLNIKDR